MIPPSVNSYRNTCTLIPTISGVGMGSCLKDGAPAAPARLASPDSPRTPYLFTKRPPT